MEVTEVGLSTWTMAERGISIMIVCLYSGASLIRTPLAHKKVSLISGVELYVYVRTKFGRESVSLLERSPYFKGFLREIPLYTYKLNFF